jgi:hypothetical protein
MIQFEWDENKNIINQRKHGISFEEAAYVFSDRENISIPDMEHSENEERRTRLFRKFRRETMKKKYDFSKGVKGKFYVPKEEILLPLYLNKKNQDFYLKLAKQKNITLSDLINSLLSKDKEIINQFIS